MGWPAFTATTVVTDLRAVGEHLRDHPELPRAEAPMTWIADINPEASAPAVPAREPGPLDATACLGGAAILAIRVEGGDMAIRDRDPPCLGRLSSIVPYLQRRFGGDPDSELPDLPVPEEFRQVFRDWAEGGSTSPSQADGSGAWPGTPTDPRAATR